MNDNFGDQLLSAISSDFVVGLVFGLILSLASAVAVEQIQRWRFIRNTKALCSDLVESVCAYIREFEEERRKSGVIQRDYLHLIDVEIAVYDRTREHFSVNLPPEMRKEVRDFFTRVTATSSRIKNHLRRFDDHYMSSERATEIEQKEGHSKESQFHLDRAREQSSHLSAIMNERGETLLKRLQ